MADRADILSLLCTLQPDDIVGWRGEETIRGAEFLTRVGQWQSLLASTPGSNVALYFADSIEFAAALFGAWHADKTAYLPSDILPATCASLRSIVSSFLGDFPADCAPLSPTATDRVEKNFRDLNADFTSLVVFTSGSTGAPQAITKKLSQLATEVATLEQLFGKHAANAEVVATVSHQHIYGLLFKVLWPLACARPIHARSLSYPEELVQLTASRDCILLSSPAHLKRLPESPAWVAAAHRVRAVFSSGGPLPLDVVRTTEQVLSQVPIEVYGSSETGGIAWRQRYQNVDEAWQLMPHVEARIDTDGDVLEIRSPHLPDASWFRTSDRARMADANRIVLQGRVDRIVKIEEKRISLDLIEAQLMKSPLVTEARVLVLAGQRQRVAAVVVLSDTGRDTLAASGKHVLNTVLRDWLASVVERIALPRSWRYPDAFPVNAQGKTTQAELLALLDAEPAALRPRQPRRRVIEQDAQRVLLELEAPHDLIYFDGHFPGTPILPGVAQVEWAVMLGREYFDLPPQFRGIHALKFQRVIRPDTAFSLELLHDPAKGSLSFKYSSADGAHASGRMLFGAGDV
jgi:acyl-CoA synthetase (AMP-forming)/AMP-acid ligase II